MYKVFFKDRVAILGDQVTGAWGERAGLYYRYSNRDELKELLESFSVMTHNAALYIVHDDLEALEVVIRSCFKCLKAAGGVVRNGHGDILIIERNGVWDLPKGKLEKGEDFEAAAIREVGEETGLKELKICQPLVSTFHTYRLPKHHVLKETVWFWMDYPGHEEPVLQKEEGITGYRWVSPGKANFILENSYGSILDVLKTAGLL
jgi:8-oxo-dGTP pyrophosphatase MutT (NUDIX family)